MTKIDSFSFVEGRQILRRYQIVNLLGSGWEGEVYKIIETSTGVERAAKFFFPQRNKHAGVSKIYARKLHKLRNCPILIQYHSQEQFIFRSIPITVFISEFVDGPILKRYLENFPGNRMSAFEALHLLYSLVVGVHSIHEHNEYHGDLHTENIIISKHGLHFDVKLVDLLSINQSKRDNRKIDIVSLVHIFYEVLGGKKHYAKQSDEVKAICCGLKTSLILKKFKTINDLRAHIENIEWH